MINSIELFTDAGGLAMGMQQAGCHHRALIEWDKDSCDTLRGNIASKGMECNSIGCQAD